MNQQIVLIVGEFLPLRKECLYKGTMESTSGNQRFWLYSGETLCGSESKEVHVALGNGQTWRSSCLLFDSISVKIPQYGK